MAEESDKVDSAKAADGREGAPAADPRDNAAGVPVPDHDGERVKWTPATLDSLGNAELQIGSKVYKKFCQNR